MKLFYAAALAAFAVVDAQITGYYNPNAVTPDPKDFPGPNYSYRPAPEGTKRPSRRPRPPKPSPPNVPRAPFDEHTEGYEYVRPAWEKAITEFRHKDNAQINQKVLPGSHFKKINEKDIKFYLVALIGQSPCSVFELVDVDKRQDCQDRAQGQEKCHIEITYDGTPWTINDVKCEHV